MGNRVGLSVGQVRAARVGDWLLAAAVVLTNGLPSILFLCLTVEEAEEDCSTGLLIVRLNVRKTLSGTCELSFWMRIPNTTAKKHKDEKVGCMLSKLAYWEAVINDNLNIKIKLIFAQARRDIIWMIEIFT